MPTPRKWFWQKLVEITPAKVNDSLANLTQVVNAPHRRGSVNVTGNYTVLYDDSVVMADATSAPLSVTLPTTALAGLRPITIVRVNGGGNAVTIVGTVNGVIDPTLSSQWSKKTVFPIPGSTGYAEIA